MRDVCDFYPCADDDDTRDVLDDAVATLGVLRDFPPPGDDFQRDNDPYNRLAFHDDPALRLHLLASLQQQLNADIVHAALAARDHGHAANEIAILLDYTTT